MAARIERSPGYHRYRRNVRSVAKRRHVLWTINAVEYAAYLHFREGLYIFDIAILRRVIAEILIKRRRTLGARSDVIRKVYSDKAITQLLEEAAWIYINFLKSLTNKLSPPVRAGEGMRRQHPGGWADDKGNLVNGFWFTVDGRAFNQAAAEAADVKARAG